MRTTLCFLLMLSLLVLGQAGAVQHSYAAAQTTVTLGVDIGHSNLHVVASELAQFASFLSANSIKISYSTGTLNQSFLNSVSMLLISAPEMAYSSSEISLLSSWNLGGGGVWLAASFENSTSISNLNLILRGLSSTLGLASGYTTDPMLNLNSTSADENDVIAPVVNHSGSTASSLAANVRLLYAYRPVPILGYTSSQYHPFNSSLQPLAQEVVETSSSAQARNSSGIPVNLYYRGGVDRIPIVAAETIDGGKLALTGYPVFSSWSELFTYNQQRPFDNRVLVSNAVQWLSGAPITSEAEVVIPRIHPVLAPLGVQFDVQSLNLHRSAAELVPYDSIVSDLGIKYGKVISFEVTLLQNASTIIILSPQRTLSSDEIVQIQDWLKLGNKTLILAGGASDSSTQEARMVTAYNYLLLSLSSKLAFEQGAVYDYDSNMGGNPYLNLATFVNHNTTQVGNLTSNVRSAYLSYATIIAEYNGTTIAPLEKNISSLSTVSWILRTSNNSALFSLNSTMPFLAHKQGDRGSFITAAMERQGSNRIIAIGSPIFSNFDQILRYPTVYGYPNDNSFFIRNLFTSLFNQTQTVSKLQTIEAPSPIILGGSVHFDVQYTSLGFSASTLNNVTSSIVPGNVALSFAGNTVNLTRLSNNTYTATITPTKSGQNSWTVTASSNGYQTQTASGSVQVNPPSNQFTWYVLSIPVVIFIAVTVAVVARKTR